MPFTDQDREKLTEVHTMVHSHLPRLVKLEEKTAKIENRQFYIFGFGGAIGAVISAVGAFFRA